MYSAKVSTFKIASFRWNKTKKTLHKKTPMEWGEFPGELWIQGKYNRVRFVYKSKNDAKRHAYYSFVNVIGQPNPHLDNTIQVVIPWKK